MRPWQECSLLLQPFLVQPCMEFPGNRGIWSRWNCPTPLGFQEAWWSQNEKWLWQEDMLSALCFGLAPIWHLKTEACGAVLPGGGGISLQAASTGENCFASFHFNRYARVELWIAAAETLQLPEQCQAGRHLSAATASRFSSDVPPKIQRWVGKFYLAGRSSDASTMALLEGSRGTWLRTAATHSLYL